MTELENLKLDIEKYKLENRELRVKLGKSNNTIAFRLGNILVMGVQNYRSFLKIPVSLFKLRQDVKSKRKPFLASKSDASEKIILSEHDKFILRDNIISASRAINGNEVFLTGTVFSEVGEKKNEAKKRKKKKETKKTAKKRERKKRERKKKREKKKREKNWEKKREEKKRKKK